MRLALFASGNGSNVESIIQAIIEGRIDASVACVFSDNPHAYVIERAKKYEIPYFVCSPRQCASRNKWEELILSFLEEQKVDWIILAGFMRIISEPILKRYPRRIINIHPSLLPDFPGKQSIVDVFEAKIKQTGVTVHYVDRGIDTGPIIAQEKLSIERNWDLPTLERKIHQIEHQLYPKVIQEVIQKERFNS